MSDKPVPSVVLFRALGREQAALVLAARDGETSHLGSDDEPILTLAVVKLPPPNAPYKRPTTVQAATATPEIEILHDVVHASHEFDEEYWKAKKISNPTPADIAAHRGHGEWTEYVTDHKDFIQLLRNRVELAAEALAEAEEKAGREKARADIAEAKVAELTPKPESAPTDKP